MTRVAVVTGGGSGLGQSISAHLARGCRRVAVLDIDTEAAEKVSAELTAAGTSAIAVGVDVSDAGAVAGAFETVRDKLGPV
jgi:2-hydroxycyclohexanecarboxyl-CoA dehydrogenase